MMPLLGAMMPLLGAARLGVALLVAAAPVTPRQAALFTVLSHDDSVACSPAQLRAATASAQFTPLGRLSGDEVLLAEVGGSCLCGAQNCPYVILRVPRAGAPREMFSTFGIAAKVVGRPAPLAPVRFLAHDSAMVGDEAVVAFRNGAYRVVSSGRVRASDNARKPESIPVRFAPGASSARLHGTASLGWDDVYAFTASAGQRVIVRDVASRARVTLSLFPANGDLQNSLLQPNRPFVLPKAGAYRLHVETGSETDAAYALTLEIR